MQAEFIKRCIACGVDKPSPEFHNRAVSPDGKHPRCKPCTTEYQREQRTKHRETRLRSKRAYYQANKAASSERGRQYRAANPDAVRASAQRWRNENRESYRASARTYIAGVRRRVLEHYSDGAPVCACCGEWRFPFLSLDHTDGGGNAHRRRLGLAAGNGFYRWVIQNGFPPLFRVLCHNCNSARGYYGACPHDDER
jgi:hypothetical protein